MKNEKYNGWHNRDTWLVVLWLENDEYNYKLMKKYYKYMLKGKAKFLKQFIKYNFIIKDKLNWSKVSTKEIKKMLKENFEQDV